MTDTDKRQVSTAEVENIGNSLKRIADNLKDNYDSILDTITKINLCLKTLESYDGHDAIKPPYPYKFSGNIIFTR